MSRSPLHLWMPGMFDFKGGIQTYSGFFLRALQTILPDVQIEAFLMHDRPRSPSRNTMFHCSGHLPRKARALSFSLQAVTAGICQRPQLVISTHLNFTPAAYRLKQLTGTPYWTVAHGFEAWNIQRPELKQALAHADRILAVSRYTRDRLLQEQALSPDQVSLLPNTFDQNRFQIAPKPPHLLQKYGLTSDQPIILTVNRLAAGEPYHPYDRVLAALPQIRQELPQVRYLIVGQGDDRQRLEQYIVQQGLQDCVILAGFIPDAELPDYYNLCDVFAMPGKLEGFGIVFLEALASGKPVLGSNQDGSVDALAGGRLGALVNPDDTGAIAHALIQLLQKTYPNPLMDNPDALRQATIWCFGIDRFQHSLSHLLKPLFYPESCCDSIIRELI